MRLDLLAGVFLDNRSDALRDSALSRSRACLPVHVCFQGPPKTFYVHKVSRSVLIHVVPIDSPCQ